MPPYLTLLNLNNNSSVEALNLLKEILSQHNDLNDQIVALIAEMNWRPQLVGAVSIALGCSNQKSLIELWHAFDSGSWVSPQLAVVASIADPDFSANAKRRIESCCSIDAQRLNDANWLQRHSAAGPDSIDDHSSKALAALVALCRQQKDFSQWFESLANYDTVQETIKKDQSDSGTIALRWLEQFHHLVQLTN